MAEPLSPDERKNQGKLLRKDILSEREYLDELVHCIQHLQRCARDGDPHLLYDAGQYVKRQLECYPKSSVIAIDIQM